MKCLASIKGFLYSCFVAVVAHAAPASAEVFCSIKSFSINGYINGQPALEDVKLTSGAAFTNISLCGESCSDPATSQRLSIALSAQAAGSTLILYFADIADCSAVTAYKKPYGIRIVK